MSAKPKQELIEAATADVVPANADSIMAVIARAAADPTVNVEKLERLTALYERITARSAEQSFNDAMSKAQAEMRPVAADASNPQTRSKYASYLALDRAMRPIYTKHGFALNFNTEPGAQAETINVVCDVSNGGFTRRYTVAMPADGKGAKGGDVMTKTHAVGSALTYGQRYLLKLIFNVAVGDDDDGNAAGSGDKITEDQAITIRELIESVGADPARFCKYMGVARVIDIPAAKFKAAVSALEAKRNS